MAALGSGFHVFAEPAIWTVAELYEMKARSSIDDK
jgi:hypothetical protein